MRIRTVTNSEFLLASGSSNPFVEMEEIHIHVGENILRLSEREKGIITVRMIQGQFIIKPVAVNWIEIKNGGL